MFSFRTGKSQHTKTLPFLYELLQYFQMSKNLILPNKFISLLNMQKEKGCGLSVIAVAYLLKLGFCSVAEI